MNPNSARELFGRTIWCIYFSAYLMLCCDGLQRPTSLNVKEVFDACYTRKSIRCDVKDNVLHCQNVQQTKWNLSVIHSIRNVTDGLSDFISYRVLPTNMKPTSNEKPPARGVCFFRTKRQLPNSTKKANFCHFLSPSVRSNKPHRRKRCECVCDFDYYPHDAEVFFKALESPDRLHEAKSNQANNREKKNSSWIPPVRLDWVPSEEPERRSTKNLVLQFSNSGSPYEQYSIRVLSGINCCRNENPTMHDSNVFKENERKMVRAEFKNLKPGNYCVRISPPKVCLNSNYEETLVHFPTGNPPDSPHEIEKSKVLYVTMGLSIAFVMLVAVGIAKWVCRPRLTTHLKVIEVIREPITEPFLQKTVFIIYSEDCPEFTKVIVAFSRFLKNKFNCKVVIPRDESDLIIENKHAWIEEKLRSDKVIVVSSEGACLRQESWLNNSPLRPCDDTADYESCLFEDVLDSISQKADTLYDYKKVLVVTFPFCSRKLKEIVPQRRYEIPKDLGPITRDLPKLKNVLSETDKDYQCLLTAIREYENFINANPNYITNSLVPVNRRTLQRPTILIPAEQNSNIDDDSFSSPQSNSSKTYLWTAC